MITNTATMTAAAIDRFGGPEEVRLVETPIPAPEAGEVLVRVRATTVSIADRRLRAREVPPGLGLIVGPSIGFLRPRTHVLGMDAAGTVEQAGEGADPALVGTAVVLKRGGFGCHAQFVAVPAESTAPIPEGMSFEDAAALLFGGDTALTFLGGVALEEGTEILVNGGSGAVGTSLIQLAAHAGARVTAVTSGPNADLVRSLGAADVIDYREADFAASGSYDVIADCVGNAGYSRVRRVLRRGGTLLRVVSGLGGMLTAPISSARLRGRVTFTGKPLSPGESLRELMRLAAAGTLRPVIDRTYDLDEIADAHAYVDTGRKRGNVVIRVS